MTKEVAEFLSSFLTIGSDSKTVYCGSEAQDHIIKVCSESPGYTVTGGEFKAIISAPWGKVAIRPAPHLPPRVAISIDDKPPASDNPVFSKCVQLFQIT